MSENPYQSPESESQSSAALDKSKRRNDLEKLEKARKYTLLIMPFVAVSTLWQYAGTFSPGNLPNWFGLVVVALCGIQLPLLSRKITKLESEISGA